MSSSTRKKILCVEDHTDSGVLVGFILSKEGYEVITAEAGEEGLRLAKGEKFDLFIFDIWLPGISGIELCRKIREFNQETPIIFYTALAFEADRQNGLSAGAQAYLIKPDDTQHLLTTVETLLKKEPRAT
ncbi:MAG: response regulator [Acidobacteria bacterium]|nr:response regulator [Acidobacteriota bacterium]